MLDICCTFTLLEELGWVKLQCYNVTEAKIVRVKCRVNKP